MHLNPNDGLLHYSAPKYKKGDENNYRDDQSSFNFDGIQPKTKF